jgi:SAS complex subunit 4-like protein
MIDEYQATDDDLPDIFFTDGRGRHVPESQGIDPRKRAEIAVQLHYPAISAKQKRREERAMKRHERETAEGIQDRKVYVKLSRKLQMYDWLRGLEVSFPIMQARERDFCEKLLAQFRKYTPYSVKWITRKQYDWLHQISATYLLVKK